MGGDLGLWVCQLPLDQLVAFVVGELEYVEAQTPTASKSLPKPVTVRVYTTKGLSEQGKFALDCGARIIEFFSEVYGEPYPLPKLDMIAVPDFGAGAMENWGLVTYRTIYLLFDEATSAAKTKERIAYVVAHELAHQWFGNLVSPQWWDALFLNEGFATSVGWYAVDHLFPEWKVWSTFVSDDLAQGLSLDSLRSSHPIHVPVRSPSEINQIFDAISYSKGASVIRMLTEWLGEDNFLKGIRAYIQKFKYGNAECRDLWNALGAAANMDVNGFMDAWTSETGFPLLSVKRGSGTTITVSQERFLSSGDAKPDENKTVWWCPLGVQTGATAGSKDKPQSQPQLLLKDRSGTFDVGPAAGTGGLDFIKLNRGHANFYRVFYPPEELEKLGHAIEAGTALHASDRVGLINDVFALAQARKVDTADALKLLRHFKNERDYVPLLAVSQKTDQLYSLWALEGDSARKGLEALVRSIFSPAAQRMGWEFPKGEGHLDALIRQMVIHDAGMYGDQSVIKEAQSRFKRFIGGDQAALHPNLRGAVYSMVIKHAAEGDRQPYDHVRAIWENEKLAMDQRLAALTALGHTQDEALLKETLAYGLDEKKVRQQDLLYVLRPVNLNPKGRHLSWEFVKANWDVLVRRYKNSLALLGHCVKIAGEFADKDFAKNDVEKFFADKDTSTFDRALQQTIERINTRAAWVETSRASVMKFLSTAFPSQ